MNFEKFFTKGTVVFLCAMLCCALWGSAFPFVKIGMQLIPLTSSDAAGQILFAGERFTLAGIFIVILGSLLGKKPLIPHGVQWRKAAILCLFQTIGQYIFYYIGLAHATGVNSAIVNSTANFFAILVACLVFRTEKMTWKKAAGCLLGFSGVVIVNLSGGSFNFNMSFQGEGMILISALCYAVSSVLAKIFSKDDNPVLLSGWQFVIGGLVMIAGSASAGARVHILSGEALAVLIYLAFVSTFAYSIWTILMKYNDVSRVSIFGFMTPVFGVFLSALFLREYQGFSLSYIAALAVICAGIALVTKAGDTGSR